MAEVKAITINGKTYTVEDSDSVSFGVDQNLTDDQKAQARANIGAASADVIGDIETALDAIIAIQEELIGTPTSTFTIEGQTFTVEEGMTWGEWTTSDYNTAGYWYDTGIGIASPQGDYVIEEGGYYIHSFEIITVGGVYHYI